MIHKIIRYIGIIGLVALVVSGTGNAATHAWALPDAYAYTATNVPSVWGDDSKWEKIILWGRVDSTYAGYYYKWVLGTKTLSGPTKIKDRTYLPSGAIKFSFSGDAVTYHTAKLVILNSSMKQVDYAVCVVKSVDFSKKIPIPAGTVNYTQSDAKRLIIESIVKGRALTYLYRKQNDNGSWTGAIKYVPGYRTAYPVAGTSFALLAFLVEQNTVYGSTKVKDIFYDCVQSGLAYVFSHAKTEGTASSDINGNGKRLKFSDFVYEDGIAMALLATCHDQNDVDQLHKGLPGKSSITYEDAANDAIDWASYAQTTFKNTKSNVICGSWVYTADNAGGGSIASEKKKPNNSDMSASQWPILGILSLEEKFDRTAPAAVRTRLLATIREVQLSNGSANYFAWNDLTKKIPITIDSAADNYVTGTHWSTTGTYTGDENKPDRWIMCTATVVQALNMIYRKNNKLKLECDCGSSSCANSANSFALTTKFGGCRRVARAISYISSRLPSSETNTSSLGNNYTSLGYTDRPNLYMMYAAAKALRLYYVQKWPPEGHASVNGGRLPNSGLQWENLFSNLIIQKQNSDWSGSPDYHGRIIDNWGADGMLGTSLAVLILNESVYNAGNLNTELIAPRSVRYASLPAIDGEDEVGNYGE